MSRSLSKKIRFEVFKRDLFACQYCGRTPPQVVLECDHINPVSKGGSNRQSNLITACFDCNRGKAANPLEVVLPSLKKQMEDKKEAKKQMDSYNRFIVKLKKDAEKEITELGTYWYNMFTEKDRYEFGLPRQKSIKRFLQKLPKESIKENMEMAIGRFPVDYQGLNDNDTFAYFCGICWNKIKNGEV